MEMSERRQNQCLEWIETDRLILRKPCLADAEDIFAIHSNPDTNHHNPGGPMKEFDEAQKRVLGWLGDWQEHGIGYWCIIDRAHQDLVGISGVRLMEWSGRMILNLYYRYGPQAWGKGYATEVAKEAVKAATLYQSDAPVVVRTRPTNTPAMRVAEKMGLQRRPDLDTEHVVYVSSW